MSLITVQRKIKKSYYFFAVGLLLLLLSAILPFLSWGGTGDVIVVSDSTELRTVLVNATGGEIIKLQPGEYSLELNDKYDTLSKFNQEITITSNDPDNLAIFTRVDLVGVTHLTIDRVRFNYTFVDTDGDPLNKRPFTISKGFKEGGDDSSRYSQDIKIRNSIFDGDNANGTGDPAMDDHAVGIGLSVSSTTRITIENNTFHTWYRGATFSDVHNLNLVNNEVTDIRSDGFDFVYVTDVLIESNYIYDFQKRHSSDISHADYIQFWTTNTSLPSERVTIKDNSLYSGDGSWTQSIFIRNEVVDTGQFGEEMFYRDFTITGNLIYNGHSHGITVGEVDGLEISNNTLLKNSGVYSPILGVSPRINIATSSLNVVVKNNISPGITAAVSGWDISDNIIVQDTNRDSLNHYHNLFINALPGAPYSDIPALQAIPGGPADGYGSPFTQFNDNPENLAVIVRYDQIANTTDTFNFSGQYTRNSAGVVADSGANYQWDFGDGTTATGLNINNKKFNVAGTYIITLTVTAGDETAVGRSEVYVPVSQLLDIRAGADGIADHSVYESQMPVVSTELVDGRWANEINTTTAVAFDRTKVGQIFGMTDFTYELDVKPIGSGGKGTIFKKHVDTYIRIDNSGRFVFEFKTTAGTSTIILKSSAVNFNEWHKVRASYDADLGEAKLFVDDLEPIIQTGLSGNTLGVQSWNPGFGENITLSESFIGYISRFQVWNTAYPEDQVVPEPALSLTVDNLSIETGETTSLYWEGSNINTCIASGGWSGTYATFGGPINVSPTETTTYTLACTGDYGPITKTVTIIVTEPSLTNQPPVITSTTATPSTLTLPTNTSTLTTNATDEDGDPLTYTWTRTSGDETGVSLTNANQATATATFTKAGTYTFTVSVSDGTDTVTDTVTVTVNSAPLPPTTTLTLSNNPIETGDSTTLSWNSTNTTSCTASGNWSGTKATTGTEIITPSTAGTYTYTLACTGTDGTDTKSVTLTVSDPDPGTPDPDPTVSLIATPSTITNGDTTTLTWSTNNVVTSCSAPWTSHTTKSGTQVVSPTATTNYTITCTDGTKTTTDSTTVTVTAQPAPTVSLSSNRTTLTEGESLTLSWNTTNATSCTAAGNWSGTKSINSGSETITPTTTGTYTYILTCTGPGGSANQSRTVTVNSATNPGTPDPEPEPEPTPKKKISTMSVLSRVNILRNNGNAAEVARLEAKFPDLFKKTVSAPSTPTTQITVTEENKTLVQELITVLQVFLGLLGVK